MAKELRREYPDAPIVTVGAVVFDGEHVLLARRNKQPNKGMWTLPGGAIEAGETMRQAVEREVREECGLAVQAGEVVDVLDFIFHDQAGRLHFHYVVIEIACRYLGGGISAGDDAAEARWVHPDEFDTLNVPSRARAVIAKARNKT
jgi:8-oxo-dGTP diphosphatase